MDVKTLQYWHKLEHFHPYILRDADDDNIKTWSVFQKEGFPYFAAPNVPEGKEVRYYVVHLGIFKVGHGLKKLEERLGEPMRFSDTGDDASCFCKFRLDKKGCFAGEGFQVSAFPWAIHRVVDGGIQLDKWEEDFLDFQKRLYATLTDNREPFNYDFLEDTRELFAGLLSWEPVFEPVWLRIDAMLKDLPETVEEEELPVTEEEAAAEDAVEEAAIAQAEEEIEGPPLEVSIEKNNLLNSFYVRDLERIIAEVKGRLADGEGEAAEDDCGSPAFRSYLKAAAQASDASSRAAGAAVLASRKEAVNGAGHVSYFDQGADGCRKEDQLPSGVRSRINIEEDVDAAFRLMSPEKLPPGRWPNNYGMRFMQQLNVNAFLDEGEFSQPLFSVNGPPGTGKTTLLKDVIAALVVNRALELDKLKWPDQAFVSKRINVRDSRTGYTNRIQDITPELKRFGMLVASNNNGAVENITKTLPLKEELPQQYRDSIAYFKEVSDLLLSPRESWGLTAAALGNVSNRRRFVDAFWPLRASSESHRPKQLSMAHQLAQQSGGPFIDFNYDFNQALRQMVGQASPADWSHAKKAFREAKQAVDEEYALIREQYAAAAQLRQCRKALRQFNEQAVEHAQANTGRLLTSQLEQLREEEAVLRDEIRREKKDDSLLWLKELVHSDSPRVQRLKAYEEQLDDLVAQRRKLEKALPGLFGLPGKKPASSAGQKTAAARQTFLTSAGQTQPAASAKELKEKIAGLEQQMADFRQQKGLPFTVEQYFDQQIRQENPGWAKSSPWGYQELNQLRERLFLEALNLHHAFVTGSKQLRENLDGFSKWLRGMIPAAKVKDVAPMLLQSFFLVVPVVSTTFASVGTFLKDIPEDEIACLFIDEAGQAAPQTAAGALWRAKKAIVVGDPLQIEPIVTIHDQVTERLGDYYGQSDLVKSKYTSAQTFADQVNYIGSFRSLEQENDLWIGAPLTVHSRCQKTIFDISNEIAYNNKMVFATKPAKEQCCWVDVKGEASSGHYVPAQAERLCPLVIQHFQRYLTGSSHALGLPPLFIITPFRSVRDGLRKDLKKMLERELMTNLLGLEKKRLHRWLTSSIGTIHTFQGKEADSVIVCLGVGPGAKGEGAARWASQRPNILNVAVTRARNNLYIVGDKQIWGNKPYFDDALAHCELWQ